MDPSAYLPPIIEAEYTAAHPGLTDDARALLRAEVRTDPGKYAQTDRTRALVAYAAARSRLVRGYNAISDLPDEEFEPKRERLFADARASLHAVLEQDRRCVEARLLDILLGGRTYDDCIRDMLALERETCDYLLESLPGFDPEAPVLVPADAPAAVPDPVVVGWLHTVESLSQCCIATARYRAGERYARIVLSAAGYPNRAEGTLFLALARLEDEEGFFSAVEHCRDKLGRDVEASPWFLLSRALLFYKLGKYKQARRAVKDFATRCDGGAYFLGSPVFPAPYLPVRPEPRESWDESQQAVFEADGILIDTPDFVQWATSIAEVAQAAEEFGHRTGYM